MTPMNAFVTEGNVEIFLSRLHMDLTPVERDNLLRLLIAELDRMGSSREHLLNGERRVADGHDRVARQREIVATLPPAHQSGHQATLRLETLEKTQVLLERHLEALRKRSKAAGL